MYNPERMCQYCKNWAHRTEYCPSAQQCIYCHGEGHGIVRCSKVKCRRCGVKGHHQSVCEAPQPPNQIGWAPSPAPGPTTITPSTRLPHAQGTRIPIRSSGPSAKRSVDKKDTKDASATPPGQQAKRQKLGLPSTSRNLNVTIWSPEHSEERWLAIEEDVREDLSVQPVFVFPALQTLCRDMITEIVHGLLPGSLSPYFDYIEAIQAHGGVDKVTEDLIQWVNPQLRQLEGKEVTKSELDAVHAEQLNIDEPWSMPLGYAGIVGDDRALLWWRLYVGQCTLAWRRVISQHAQKIMTGSIESLFYYILWLGNGHRSVSFIKLWGCPEDAQTDKDWSTICNNILEALFCRAFRTHFGMVSRLEEWDNGRKLPTGLGWGLNIMSPLVQGNHSLTLEMRSRANASLNLSSDRQIHHWASFHPRQQERSKDRSRRQAFKQPMFRRDFDNALRQALGDEKIFQQVKATLQQPQKSILPTSPVGIPFCGSLMAEVAVLLDYASVSQAQETPIRADDTDNTSALSLPWSLTGCGFSETNILAWTCNFKAFTSLGINHLNDSLSLQSDLRNWHKSLFEASQAKIILLCGPQSARIAKAVLATSLSEHTLTLRDFTYRLYHDVSRDRLLIQCPTLPAEIWSASTQHSIQVSELLRFTLHYISSLKGVRPFFCETSGTVGYILRQARRERLGGEPMIAGNIDGGVRLWLARRNLAGEEDIKKIEEIGGSLTRGLLMLLHCLPRRPKDKVKADGKRAGQTRAITTKAEGRIRAHEPFDKESFQAMRGFVGERIEDREAVYRERLSQLANTEPQAEEPAVDSVSSLRSFQNWQNQEPSGSEKMEELVLLRQDPASGIAPEEEAEASLLQALTTDVIAEGFLDPMESASVRPVTSDFTQTSTSGAPVKRDKKRQGTKHVIWGRADIHNTEYGYQLKPGSQPQIYIYYCQIPFSQDLDIANGDIFVKVELYPPGDSHPTPYATSGSDEYGDPAVRLGFRIRYKDSYGREIVYRPQTPLTTMVFRANSFVDVLDGKGLLDIAKSPRRYIYVGGESNAYPTLEKYKHGGYTSPHS